MQILIRYENYPNMQSWWIYTPDLLMSLGCPCALYRSIILMFLSFLILNQLLKFKNLITIVWVSFGYPFIDILPVYCYRLLWLFLMKFDSQADFVFALL